jgi:LPS export ABC transporter permease LptF/LPS export ABC transporter permease LptG
MKLLDRYIVREILPPFAIALLVFTFVLIIPFIIEMAEQLIAKGVPWLTLLRLTATLVPQALGLTIPMAFLLAILVALGRLSADREVVVLMACGVSPLRKMRPVLVLAVICWAATSWVMIEAIPNENQNYREITMRIIADRAEGQVRPREFFEDFPDTVLYVREVPPTGGWVDVFAANTRNPAEPEIFVASRGRMVVNREKRTIEMVLEDGTRHRTKLSEPATYEVVRFKQTILNLNPDNVFPRTGPARGDRELSIADLKQKIAEFEANGLSAHNQIIEIHKKFSIPIACFVFAFIGLGLAISNRRDGKLASFVLGIGVIFIYYIVMFGAHSMTKGGLLPAWLAMWVPNIVLGVVGLVLVWSRATAVDTPIRLAIPAWLAKRVTALTGDATDATPIPGRQTAPRRSRPVMVIRIPRLNYPRPNLLDLYISRLYLRILVIATLGMAGLFYISTFIDLSDKWFKGQTTLGTLVAYLGWETPQFMAWILAIAVLLSALVTIGLLTKSSELIVMRACGVSLYRTALPLLLFGVIAGALLFALEERVLSVTNRRAAYLKHLIRTGSPQTFDVLNRKWLMGRNGEIYRYEYYDPRRQELNALSVFEFDPQTRALVRRTFATRATYIPRDGEDDALPWYGQNGWQREFAAADVTTFKQYQTARLPLEPASYFVTEAPEPDRMNFAQLKAYIATLMASGYNVLEYEVGLHRKIAYPFVAVIMTLIAVPFAVTTGRRGAMYGIGVGIVLALVYWTMISIFAAVGSAGVIPPLLAAWAPNLIFGAAAAYLLLTVRT